MLGSQNNFNEKLIAFLQAVAGAGAKNAARGFEGMVGEKLTVTEPSIRVVDLKDIPDMLGGAEQEAVGIYLRIEGDLTGQIMLVVPYEKALELVEMIIGPMDDEKPTEIGRLERSALAEVGNLTGAFFLNSISSMTGLSLRPSPPAVIVDMVGAILDIIAATAGGVSDQVLVLGTNFEFSGRQVKTEFWLIPDASALDVIAAKTK